MITKAFDRRSSGTTQSDLTPARSPLSLALTFELQDHLEVGGQVAGAYFGP